MPPASHTFDWWVDRESKSIRYVYFFFISSSRLLVPRSLPPLPDDDASLPLHGSRRPHLRLAGQSRSQSIRYVNFFFISSSRLLVPRPLPPLPDDDASLPPYGNASHTFDWPAMATPTNLVCLLPISHLLTSYRRDPAMTHHSLCSRGIRQPRLRLVDTSRPAPIRHGFRCRYSHFRDGTSFPLLIISPPVSTSPIYHQIADKIKQPSIGQRRHPSRSSFPFPFPSLFVPSSHRSGHKHPAVVAQWLRAASLLSPVSR